MKNPLVSICCQTYNHKNYIKQAIEGFLKQKTNFQFEILLRDDASTDGTAEICKKYASEYPELINLLAYKENQFQKGISPFRDNVQRSKGKYIALCEGDDYWTDPLKLQKQVDFLEANQDFSFCFHRVKKVDDKGKVLISAEICNNVTFYNQEKIFDKHVYTASLVMRNDIDFNIDLFKEVSHGDALLVALLATKGKAADLGFLGANYRIHPGGVYSGKSMTQRYLNTILTRRIMLKSDFFTNRFKMLIRKQMYRKKRKYLTKLLRKRKIQGFFRLLCT